MAVFSGLFVVSIFFIVYVNTASVPVPENVKMKSLDLGLVLEWDPPQNATNKLFNYTAEMKCWRDYDPVCVRSLSLNCDLTHVCGIHGRYQARVRTELHGETSDWVETEPFTLDEITEISAPRVELRSRKGQTEVDITDPPMRRTNLRDVFSYISYLIRYWKNGEAEKVELMRDQNRVLLPNLEPLLNYCVEVAVVCSDSNKTSQFSNATCVTHSPSNEVEPQIIVAVLLVSCLVVIVAVVLLFLAAWYSYKAWRIIFPDAKLPENLKQFLSQQSPSSILEAMQKNTQLKEHFHDLRIVHEEPDSSQDNQLIEGADVTQHSEEKSEMARITSEEEHLLAS